MGWSMAQISAELTEGVRVAAATDEAPEEEDDDGKDDSPVPRGGSPVKRITAHVLHGGAPQARRGDICRHTMGDTSGLRSSGMA